MIHTGTQTAHVCPLVGVVWGAAKRGARQLELIQDQHTSHSLTGRGESDGRRGEGRGGEGRGGEGRGEGRGWKKEE